ncbi:MAG TPA: hypothetical protein VFB80_17640 [Pirellulaceae bacterium]|nr:hypothetical protein [Pirellulaceae bacterium]
MARLFIGYALALALVAIGQAEDDQPTKYAFTQPPLAIYGQVADLKLGAAPTLSDVERKLLEKVTRLRSESPAAKELRDESLILEALLFASGCEDAAARARYREQYEKLVVAAKEATKDAKTDRERGEALMKFLHAGVMSKGYDLDETTLTAIFDQGKFNCVSSSAMYYLVGSRLGLKLQLISIPGGPFLPGHAALDLIDGRQRVQVEPTNPDGFDWQTKIKRPGVIVLGFVPDRKQGREVDPLGLAATIYSNRGVELGKSDPPRRLEEARMYASALALDPLTSTATNNLTALFTNWGPALADDQKFEEGVRVLALGRSLALETRDLENNLSAVWSQHIKATLEVGRDKDALELIRRAAEMVKSDRDFADVGKWFIIRAQDREDAEGWEAGLKSIESSLGVVPAAEVKKLREWRSSLFRRWSQEHLEKGAFDASVKALARGYAIDAADSEIHSGLGYHTAEALKQLDGPDTAKMVAHYQSLVAQFPKVKKIADAARSHAGSTVSDLAEAGKFAEAQQALARYQPLLADAKDRTEIGVMIFGRWGQDLTEKKEWKAALARLSEGRKAYPKERRLEDGIAATIDAWAEGFINDQKWDEAIRIYDIGLKDYLPGNSHLKRNREFCEAKKAGK